MASKKTAHPDRVLFPRTGFTRNDAADYYRAVAKVLLPHIRNRPLSFKRYPDTVDGDSFWEKDAPAFTPSWVKRIEVPRRSGDLEIEYVVANDARTLVWIAGVGGIEIHPFLHRAPALDRPTDVVFDLDPGPGASILDCCRVAVILRDALAASSLQSFVKVSGSKGLQVYVPLNTAVTHEQTESFARLVAEEMARAHPRLIVAKMAKALRAKRVFIDWSQNASYKTTVAVYSLRSKSDEPFVSMPMRWKEIEQARDKSALYFTPEAALKRLRRAGDLWADTRKLRQHIGSPPPAGARERPRPTAADDRVVINGIRLPRPKSQSGRRLFVLPKTEMGNELWLDMRGRFRRWILRPDRTGAAGLIAMPAGHFPVDAAYYRGEVPKEWRSRVALEDIGIYEVIEGSHEQRRFELYFTGRVLSGPWLLQKGSDDPASRSWTLTPAE